MSTGGPRGERASKRIVAGSPRSSSTPVSRWARPPPRMAEEQQRAGETLGAAAAADGDVGPRAQVVQRAAVLLDPSQRGARLLGDRRGRGGGRGGGAAAHDRRQQEGAEAASSARPWAAHPWPGSGSPASP